MTLDAVTDAALVRRVLAGEPDAFTLLVDRHAGACLRFAGRLLGDRADAEDVTQETLLRAHAALGRYDEGTSFRTWLFAILLNRCRTALARRSRWHRRVVTDDDAVSRARVDMNVTTTEWREELARALARLDAQQREAFLLKHVEQLGYDEMAVITGASVPALKMRVKRACEHLRQLLGEVRDAGR